MKMDNESTLPYPKTLRSLSQDQTIDFGEYRYQCDVVYVVDGDTFDIDICLGFDITKNNQRVRLSEIDTGEIRFVSDPERGYEHMRFVEEWFADAVENYDGRWPFVIVTERDNKGSYGRYLAAVWRKSDGTSLAHALLDEYGDEVRYDP